MPLPGNTWIGRFLTWKRYAADRSVGRMIRKPHKAKPFGRISTPDARINLKRHLLSEDMMIC